MVIRKICKDNSVYLPSILLKDLKLKENDEVIIYIKNGELRIRSLYQ